VRDADIRAVLRAAVTAQHAADPDTRIVDELGLRQGTVRVDLAVVNGVTHGYEIKSLADTLRRLPGQVAAYSAVLDFATLVLAERHRAEAQAMIPKWWGVIVAKEPAHRGIRLSVARKARRNEHVDKRALAELLWRDEAMAMLVARDAARGMLSKPRAAVWDRLCEVCTLDELSAAVRARLKDRATRQAAQ
jgi:hypothetical protein